MTDKDRKLLTGYLGERFFPGLVGRPYTHEGEKNSNRAFDTWDDLGALLTKLTTSTKWWAFIDFARNRPFVFNPIIDDFASGFARWLLQDPSRFCQLILEAIEKGVIK